MAGFGRRPPIMSTINRKLTSVALAFSFLALTSGCGPDPADPKSPEQVLLDNAIEALWGDVDPKSVVALKTRSILTETQDDFSSTFELETLMASDKCYQEIRSWKDFDLREEFIQGPKKSWHRVDGTVVDLEAISDEMEPQSRQNWLFEISKLTALKDTEHFKLKHKGTHIAPDKRKIERLEVQDLAHRNILLTFDFDTSTWLVERVTLDDKDSDKSFTLILREYRSVAGVQFAHEIDSLQNGKPHAQQREITYQLNPKWSPKTFEPPIDLNRDAIIDKRSIGGTFAYLQLEESDDDVQGAVAKLKAWIHEKKLEINGPLLLVHPAVVAPGTTTSKPTRDTTQVAIAIKAPTPEVRQKLQVSGEEFGLLDLKSHRALCLTQVGATSFAEIQALIVKQGKNLQPKMGASALEIYFSPEGTIRQVQVPVE